MDADERRGDKGVTVRDMIRGWLKDHGYDGLCSSDCEYGCVSSCLCVCDSPEDMVHDCKAAYAYVIPEDDETGRRVARIAFSREEVSKRLSCDNCAHSGTDACEGEEGLCFSYAEAGRNAQ